MLWFLVGVLGVAFFYFFMVKPFSYWQTRSVPQFSVAETLYSILRYTFFPISVGTLLQKMYEHFPGKRYCGTYQLNKPILVLRDPELIKQLTVKDFDHFVDHFQFTSDEPIWDKNLFALKGDKWRDMRATLSPSFTSSKMKAMFGLISDCAKQYVQYFLDQDKPVVVMEMKDCFSRFTNDVIATTAFGIVCNSLKNRDNEFYTMGKKMTDFSGILKVLKFFFILLFPKLSQKLGVKVFSDELYNFFKRLITENISTREREGIVRPDMIHLLMEARKERGKTDKSVPEQQNGDVDEGFAAVQDDPKPTKRQKAQLTDEDIMAQALIFFFAGFDTVSTGMCFMAHELAVNPDIHDRLQDEVDATLEECGGSLTYESLMKMKYMDMVVSETLRKWPAAPRIDRVCVKPYTIQPKKSGEQPIRFENDDMIWVPIYAIHRDPNNFPEPDRFDPERFNDENKSKVASYTYLAFGSGPRSCLGSRFALMEIKSVFFHILSKFDIVVVEKTGVPLKLDKSAGQLGAEGGFWLGLKRRS